MIKKLFNDEYFIHIPPDYKNINTNKGCHIDQVLGQSFAYQVNLPNVLPSKETRSALKALWKYIEITLTTHPSLNKLTNFRPKHRP